MKADCPDININAKKMEIINIIATLPRNPSNGAFRLRKLDKINTIIVHHSASKGGLFPPLTIAKWHIDPNGRLRAPGICYHFSIEQDGTIYQVNTLESIPWHAGPANNNSIGIELNGNFEVEQPTDAQLHSLRWLTAQLEQKLAKNLIQKGHKEVQATACPGKNMFDRKSEWRNA